MFTAHQLPKYALLPNQNLSICEMEILLLQQGGENPQQKGTAQRRFFRDTFLAHCSCIICLHNSQLEKFQFIVLVFFFFSPLSETGNIRTLIFPVMYINEVNSFAMSFQHCGMVMLEKIPSELARKEKADFLSAMGRKVLLFLY